MKFLKSADKLRSDQSYCHIIMRWMQPTSLWFAGWELYEFSRIVAVADVYMLLLPIDVIETNGQQWGL